jgi:hypothetical protein
MSYEGTNLILQRQHSESNKQFSEINFIQMLKSLADNIFDMFGGRVFTNSL